MTVLVYARTESASLTALTYGLTILPAIVSGPLLSGLADRYRRRTVMVAADIARAGLVAMMAIPGVPLVWLCALLVATQMLAAPFNAARAATLPEVLDGDRYRLAVSLSNMTYQAALLFGFASGGMLVVTAGPSGALLIDAATFLVSAVLVRWGTADRPLPDAGKTGSPATGWARSISAGARLVWSQRQLRQWVWLLCMCAFPVAVEGLAVPYAAALGAGAVGAGLLLAAGPAGSLLGMLALNRLPPALRLRAVWPLAVAASAVLVLCALRPDLGFSMALWTISGAAVAYLVVVNGEFVRATPAPQRGQAVGLASTAMRVCQGLAVLAAGILAERLDPATAVALAGAAGVVVTGLGWLTATRRPADIDTPADRP